MKVIKCHILIYVLLLIANSVLAQLPTIKTFVDKNSILIGEPIQYKVVATLPANTPFNWFTVKDSFPHFEVINKNKVDSILSSNSLQISQSISFTSFDSGKWSIPRFAILVNNKNYFTDSVSINVSYAVADSTNLLRDIKPIIEVEEPNYLLYYIIGGVLLFLLAILVIKKLLSKNKKINNGIGNSKVNAFDEAMHSLQMLGNEINSNTSSQKTLHSKLHVILKRYLSRKQQTNFVSNTTDEVLLFLRKNNNLEISTLANTLRLGDAVKFAKYNAEENAITESALVVKEFIYKYEKVASAV